MNSRENYSKAGCRASHAYIRTQTRTRKRTATTHALLLELRLRTFRTLPFLSACTSSRASDGAKRLPKKVVCQKRESTRDEHLQFRRLL